MLNRDIFPIYPPLFGISAESIVYVKCRMFSQSSRKKPYLLPRPTAVRREERFFGIDGW